MYYFSESLAKSIRYSALDKLLILFCGVHLFIWTLVPSILYGNPPTDALEGIAWGKLWLLGYPKHPFLTPWLTAFFTKLFGGATWSLYLLAQICVVSCFLAVWSLARRFLKPGQALISVMLLEGIHYYTISAANFNPNVLMLPLWALLIVNSYEALKHQKIHHWLLVGIFAGLAMLCKYESALLIVTLLIVTVTTKEGRNSFARPGFYVAILSGLVVFSPNLYYLMQNNFDAIRYALSEMQDSSKVPLILSKRLYQPLEFLVEQAASLIPLLLLSWPWLREKRPAISLATFEHRFLIIVSFGPLIFTLLLSLINNASLVSRWGFPFFSLFGILLVIWLNPKYNFKKFTHFIVLLVMFLGIEIIGITLWIKLRPFVSHKASNAIYFPGKHISDLINRRWKTLYHCKLPYIIGEYQTVVNVAAYSKDASIPFFENSLIKSPWINVSDLNQKGAAIVYLQENPENVTTINAVKQMYPNVSHEFTQNVLSLTTAAVAPIKIWVGFLPPK